MLQLRSYTHTRLFECVFDGDDDCESGGGGESCDGGAGGVGCMWPFNRIE